MYLNEIFGALTDPTRLKIVKLLSRKDLAASELGEHFDITAPSLSHHLSVLLQAGLICQERQGRWLIYSLKKGVLDKVAEQVRLIGQKSKK
jgi:DNA-binding transcriptional ArsR family regulator